VPTEGNARHRLAERAVERAGRVVVDDGAHAAARLAVDDLLGEVIVPREIRQTLPVIEPATGLSPRPKSARAPLADLRGEPSIGTAAYGRSADDDRARDLAAQRHRREHVDAGAGQLDIGVELRERRHLALRIDRRHRDDARVAGGVGVDASPLVARRGDDEDVGRCQPVGDALLGGAAAAAERHAHDMGAGLLALEHGARDDAARRRAAGVEHLGDEQVEALVRQDADDADRVGDRGDRARDVRAVRVLVREPWPEASG
jgi:hypothetical protein